MTESNNFGFAARLLRSGLDLKPQHMDTLQINITKLCNQACVHCHVDASPRRREMMSDAVLDQVLAILRQHPQLQTLIRRPNPLSLTPTANLTR